MTAKEIRLARTIAQNFSVDLSNVSDSALYGFGCPDFKPVEVGIEVVAKCMRWQSCQLNGGWDEKQYNEDVPHYKRNVRIATLGAAEAAGILAQVVASVMGGAS